MKTEIEICSEMLGVQAQLISCPYGPTEWGFYKWETDSMIRYQWLDHTKMVGWIDKSDPKEFIFCHWSRRPLS
jgi:hypothetical protein